MKLSSDICPIKANDMTTQVTKYTAKEGKTLPSFKIISTQYSNGGNGKFVGSTITVYGKQENNDGVKFLFKSDNGNMWMAAAVNGKVQVKENEFWNVTYHPELKCYVKTDWSAQTKIICLESEKIS